MLKTCLALSHRRCSCFALKCSLHRQQGNIPGVLCQAVSWLPENYPCQLGLTVTALVGYFLLEKNILYRSDLLTILLDACRQSDAITLETNREVVAVDDLADGALVSCADGSTYECDALIGADGLKSVVRKYMIGDGDPICVEFVAYRGAIPMEEVIEFAGMDTIRYWIGPNLHLIQYPLRRGELYNQVAVFKSHRYLADSDDWGTEDELEEHFARTHV